MKLYEALNYLDSMQPQIEFFGYIAIAVTIIICLAFFLGEKINLRTRIFFFKLSLAKFMKNHGIKIWWAKHACITEGADSLCCPACCAKMTKDWGDTK